MALLHGLDQFLSTRTGLRCPRIATVLRSCGTPGTIFPGSHFWTKYWKITTGEPGQRSERVSSFNIFNMPSHYICRTIFISQSLDVMYWGLFKIFVFYVRYKTYDSIFSSLLLHHTLLSFSLLFYPIRITNYKWAVFSVHKVQTTVVGMRIAVGTYLYFSSPLLHWLQEDSVANTCISTIITSLSESNKRWLSLTYALLNLCTLRVFSFSYRLWILSLQQILLK